MTAGRPSKYDDDFHPEEFIRLAKLGKSMAQIARDWDICIDTIHEWKNRHKNFSESVKKGKVYLEAWYTDIGQAAMLGKAKVGGKPIQFNFGVYVWLTKNILRWTDKVDLGGIDEKPLVLKYKVESK